MEHHNMVNKCTAFMQRFNNQLPITLLYNIAQHSSTHAHIHRATVTSTMQGHSQLIRSS